MGTYPWQATAIVLVVALLLGTWIGKRRSVRIGIAAFFGVLALVLSVYVGYAAARIGVACGLTDIGLTDDCGSMMFEGSAGALMESLIFWIIAMFVYVKHGHFPGVATFAIAWGACLSLLSFTVTVLSMSAPA
jgi:hypothetical protein